MVKFVLVLGDTDEHIVLIGGGFPKVIDPKALTHAEALAFLKGQPLSDCDKQPKAFRLIVNMVSNAAAQECEPLTSVVSSDDLYFAMASRSRKLRLMAKLDSSGDN